MHFTSFLYSVETTPRTPGCTRLPSELTPRNHETDDTEGGVGRVASTARIAPPLSLIFLTFPYLLTSGPLPFSFLLPSPVGFPPLG